MLANVVEKKEKLRAIQMFIFQTIILFQIKLAKKVVGQRQEGVCVEEVHHQEDLESVPPMGSEPGQCKNRYQCHYICIYVCFC